MTIQAFNEPFRYWVTESDELGLTWTVSQAILTRPEKDIPWVHYNNDCEKSKRTCRELARLPHGWAFLLHSLLWEGFCSNLEKLLGFQALELSPDPTLHGGGIHITDPEGWLRPHLDYALHPNGMERRLNLIVFLNPEWKEEWGGAFELWDDSANKVVKKVYPAPGRIVLWEPSEVAYHGTEATSLYAPSRVTAAVYYLARARPGVTRKRALFVPKRD